MRQDATGHSVSTIVAFAICMASGLLYGSALAAIVPPVVAAAVTLILTFGGIAIVIAMHEAVTTGASPVPPRTPAGAGHTEVG